jgi:hypothetical protein
MSKHDTTAPTEKVPPTVAAKTARMLRMIEKLNEDDRARVVGALVSLYLPATGVRRDA